MDETLAGSQRNHIAPSLPRRCGQRPHHWHRSRRQWALVPCYFASSTPYLRERHWGKLQCSEFQHEHKINILQPKCLFTKALKLVLTRPIVRIENGDSLLWLIQASLKHVAVDSMTVLHEFSGSVVELRPELQDARGAHEPALPGHGHEPGKG